MQKYCIKLTRNVLEAQTLNWITTREASGSPTIPQALSHNTMRNLWFHPNTRKGNHTAHVRAVLCEYNHYSDVITSTMAFTIVSVVCSTVWSVAKKHQSFTSLASVRGIHWSPADSPHKGPVTRKMFPFDDVTMVCSVIVITALVVPCNMGYRVISGRIITDTTVFAIKKEKTSSWALLLIYLQWRHMSGMKSQVTGDSTVCSHTLFSLS